MLVISSGGGSQETFLEFCAHAHAVRLSIASQAMQRNTKSVLLLLGNESAHVYVPSAVHVARIAAWLHYRTPLAARLLYYVAWRAKTIDVSARLYVARTGCVACFLDFTASRLVSASYCNPRPISLAMAVG
jgi:hypothetical protein